MPNYWESNPSTFATSISLTTSSVFWQVEIPLCRRSQHVPHASCSNGRQEKDMGLLSPSQIRHRCSPLHAHCQVAAFFKEPENRRAILLDCSVADAGADGQVLPRVQHDAGAGAQGEGRMII
jgi:hypothetical protein